MTLFRPPNSFEVVKVETEDYSGACKHVSVYFAEPKAEDHSEHAVNIFLNKAPSTSLVSLTNLKGRAWRYDVVVAWGPAEQGLVEAFRNFEEAKKNSSIANRWYFTDLLVAFDFLWD